MKTWRLLTALFLAVVRRAALHLQLLRARLLRIREPEETSPSSRQGDPRCCQAEQPGRGHPAPGTGGGGGAARPHLR